MRWIKPSKIVLSIGFPSRRKKENKWESRIYYRERLSPARLDSNLQSLGCRYPQIRLLPCPESAYQYVKEGMRGKCFLHCLHEEKINNYLIKKEVFERQFIINLQGNYGRY